MTGRRIARVSAQRGFSLFEILVATALLAVLFVGVLQLLDASSRTSKRESALVDTQENVRFAAYHVLRNARMAGGGRLPMATSTGWATGEIISDTTTVASTTFLGTVNKDPASDVLVLAGFFETPLFRFHSDFVDTTSGTVTIPEYIPQDASGRLANAIGGFSVNDAFAGNGIVLFGPDLPSVAEVSTGGVLQGTGFARELVLPYQGGTSPWNDMVEGGYSPPPPNEVFQAGILSAYAYWSEGGTFWRRRFTGPGTWVDESVAVNIGGFQVSLGLDTDGDGVADTWADSPAPGVVATQAPVAMQIAILGRTGDPVRNWTEPLATFDAVDPAGSPTLRSSSTAVASGEPSRSRRHCATTWCCEDVMTRPSNHRETPRNTDGERGSALLLALMVALVMLVMGLGLATQSFLGLQASATDRWVAKSFYAAEAGISVQLGLLKAGADTAPGTFLLSDDGGIPGLLAGQYAVAIEELCESRKRDPSLGSEAGVVWARTFRIRSRSNRNINFVAGTVQSGVTSAAIEADITIEPVPDTRLLNIPKCYE
jgi:prepilin-type N-terminal cleavage/methylation domain-containing protein